MLVPWAIHVPNHFPRSSLSLSFLGVQERTAVCGSVGATGIPQAKQRCCAPGDALHYQWCDAEWRGRRGAGVGLFQSQEQRKNKMDSHAAIQRSEIGMKAWYALIGKKRLRFCWEQASSGTYSRSRQWHINGSPFLPSSFGSPFAVEKGRSLRGARIWTSWWQYLKLPDAPSSEIMKHLDQHPVV